MDHLDDDSVAQEELGEKTPPGTESACAHGAQDDDTQGDPALPLDDDSDDDSEDDEADDIRQAKMVIVMRIDLGMSIGKTVAQACHAAVGCFERATKREEFKDIVRSWKVSGQAKISLEVKGEAKMLALSAKAEELNLPNYLVIDAGRTEIPAGSITAVAMMGYKDIVDTITGRLSTLGRASRNASSKRKRVQQSSASKPSAKRASNANSHGGVSRQHEVVYYQVMRATKGL